MLYDSTYEYFTLRETESRMVVARGRGEGEYYLTDFSFPRCKELRRWMVVMNMHNMNVLSVCELYTYKWLRQ